MNLRPERLSQTAGPFFLPEPSTGVAHDGRTEVGSRHHDVVPDCVARVPESDFDHLRNLVRAAFGEVPPRFAPAVAEAVAAHYEEVTAIADSPLSEADPPEPLITAAGRIILAVDQVAGSDALARRKCLGIVREMAEARLVE